VLPEVLEQEQPRPSWLNSSARTSSLVAS
jgi:hypothetical protein